jgi:hypothetical protein
MYAIAGGRRRARLGGDEYTFPGTPASFPGLGALGEAEGAPDPVNGPAYTWSSADGEYLRYDAATGLRVSPTYDQQAAAYPENPFANMTEAQKTLYWAGQAGGAGAGDLAGVYTPVNGVIDPVAQAQAAASYLQTNAQAIAEVTAAVQAAQTAHQAAENYKYDYLAQSGGDLDTWYRLANPGAERYTMASNGGALLDNALLQYMALKSANSPGISVLDASAATAQAAADAAYQASLSTGGFSTGMVAPATAQAAVQAITDAGGDPQQWTNVVDSNTGATIGVVKQLPDGSISMAPGGGASMDLASAAQTVTGFIDRAAGTIQNIGATVQKVGQAIKGAEVGATAGWNAPANLNKYMLIGGALIVATLIFRPSRRR